MIIGKKNLSYIYKNEDFPSSDALECIFDVFDFDGKSISLKNYLFT